jgi:hypothetical protein
MTPLLKEFVAFLESGEPRPDVFAADAVIDFNVPSWRFASRGLAAIAHQRQITGAGPWEVVVDRASETPSGFVVELSHAHSGEYYRTLSLVTVVNGRISEVVHYCTGNWDAATRAAYAAEH